MRQAFERAAFNFPDFALVHFRADKNKKIPDVVHAWSRANLHIPMETCARQVWAGTREHFTDFPAGDTAWDFRLLTGAPAYSYLLEIGTGLHSPRVGEDHIVRQYNVKWEEFKASHPEFELEMRPLKAAFDHDNHVVRREIVDHLIPPIDTQAIKILSGQKKGDRLLITTGIAGDGHIEGEGDKMLRFFGQDRNGRPLVEEIAISAPTAPEAQTLARMVRLLQEQKRIHRDITITALPPAQLQQAVEQYDHIIMTSPLGRNTRFEVEVITSWEERSRRDNTLTCTRGASELANRLPPLWQNAELDNFISPDDIRVARGRITEHNQHLIELARQAIEICVAKRMDGGQVRKTGMGEKIRKDLRPVSIFEDPASAARSAAATAIIACPA